MDALTFMQEFNRMCKMQTKCEKCRLYNETNDTCAMTDATTDSNINDIKTTIEIVEEWSTEHQVKSNLDVFREVFPKYETFFKRCEEECGISNCTIPCEDCTWWDEEYKGE